MDLTLFAHSLAWYAAINPDFAADLLCGCQSLAFCAADAQALLVTDQSASTLCLSWGEAACIQVQLWRHLLAVLCIVSSLYQKRGWLLTAVPSWDWRAVGRVPCLTAAPIRASTRETICYFYLFQFLLANFVSAVPIQSQDRTTFCLKTRR